MIDAANNKFKFLQRAVINPRWQFNIDGVFQQRSQQEKKEKKNARNGNETVEIISFPRNGSVKQIYTFLMEPVDVSMKVFKIYTLHRWKTTRRRTTFLSITDPAFIPTRICYFCSRVFFRRCKRLRLTFELLRFCAKEIVTINLGSSVFKELLFTLLQQAFSHTVQRVDLFNFDCHEEIHLTEKVLKFSA